MKIDAKTFKEEPTPICDSCGANGQFDITVARKLEKELRITERDRLIWKELASGQPDAFYQGMRAMQTLLTGCKQERDEVIEEVKRLKKLLHNAGRALDNMGNEFAARSAFEAAGTPIIE